MNVGFGYFLFFLSGALAISYEEAMPSPVRKHQLSITEFGAVGDNRTINTFAFKAALDKAKSLASDGGVTLLITQGTFLTTPFNLTDHITLHLTKGATLIAVDRTHRASWPVIPPLPSYGTGRGGTFVPLRYAPFIGGFNVTDVVISGEGADSSVIDGNGWLWWKAFIAKQQNITRARLIEFLWSDGILIQDLHIQNSPFWTIHPTYSSNIIGRRLVITAPQHSKNTDGFDPDSSENVTLVDTFISTGDDGIAIKSGWDCAGVGYARPVRNVYIRNVTAVSYHSAAFAIGSEMSGGVENVTITQSRAVGGGDGLHIKSSKTRGGYVRNIVFDGVYVDGEEMTSLRINEDYSGDNPVCDPEKWSPPPPVIDNIQFLNIRIGSHDPTAFQFHGLAGGSLTRIHLENVTTADGQGVFSCEFVTGSARNVSGEVCDALAGSA